MASASYLFSEAVLNGLSPEGRARLLAMEPAQKKTSAFDRRLIDRGAVKSPANRCVETAEMARDRAAVVNFEEQRAKKLGEIVAFTQRARLRNDLPGEVYGQLSEITRKLPETSSLKHEAILATRIYIYLLAAIIHETGLLGSIAWPVRGKVAFWRTRPLPAERGGISG